MNDGGTAPRRAYDNRGRQLQAQENRARVLEAAYRLLVERGYRATTMAAVAAEAGVSVETVYKAFGTKSALVKKAYDVAVVGDMEPVPLVDRPEAQAVLAEPDLEGKIRRFATLQRGIVERVGALSAALIAAARAGGDADLEALAATMDQERLAGATWLAAHLARTGSVRTLLPRDTARDIIWTLGSPEVYHLLVLERGWSHDDYERWVAGTLTATLASSPGLALQNRRAEVPPDNQPGR